MIYGNIEVISRSCGRNIGAKKSKTTKISQTLIKN